VNINILWDSYNPRAFYWQGKWLLGGFAQCRIHRNWAFQEVPRRSAISGIADQIPGIYPSVKKESFSLIHLTCHDYC